MMLKMPMSHFRFLEMISEGLFIEGFNHGRAAADHVKLEAYTTEQLEELVDTSKRRCQRPRMRAARQNIRDNLPPSMLHDLPSRRPIFRRARREHATFSDYIEEFYWPGARHQEASGRLRIGGGDGPRRAVKSFAARARSVARELQNGI